MAEDDAAKIEADAIVVGGGPAGLFLAGRLAERLRAAGPAPRSARVLLLEKMPRPGRKLLASGSGQCNVSHQGGVEDFLRRYGTAGRFLKKSLYAFSNEALAAWLAGRGVALEAEEGGKLFPVSRRASEVLKALLGLCEEQGVELLVGKRARAARRGQGSAGRGEFIIETEGTQEPARRGLYGSPLLAIACGGSSYPGTGSSGEGFELARSLGHSIVRPRPALTPVSLSDRSLCELAGLSFADLGFTQRRGGKKLASFRGDMLITHEGLSGPGILDASRSLEPGDLLALDFSGLGLEAFRSRLSILTAASPRSLTRSVLAEAGLPRRLAELLCSLAGLGEAEERCSGLRRGTREALASLAAAFPAQIASLGGFEKAMVTAGGVSLDEVDPGSMASRLVEGLYFAGEVLDYDGDTGGYNIQAAFSTAEAAAKAMAHAFSH